MDFLLVLLSIGGFVFAVVMLVLGTRARRMEAVESDARVRTLEAMATGSVLFASDGPVDVDRSGAGEPAVGPVAQAGVQRPRATPGGNELGPAWDEFRDERDDQVEHAPAHQFVLTVPAAAGGGRVLSFERVQRRRRA